MALEIHSGTAEELLPRLAAAKQASRILMPASPDPVMLASFGAVLRALPDLDLDLVEDTPFVTLTVSRTLAGSFATGTRRRRARCAHGG